MSICLRMRDSGFSNDSLDGMRIGARATIIPAGGAATGLPLSDSQSRVPNMISAMGSASLSFIPWLHFIRSEKSSVIANLVAMGGGGGRNMMQDPDKWCCMS